jgi:Alpha galactosidase C-terminal beta sandwich domain
MRRLRLTAFLLLLVAANASAGRLMYRPTREYRTLNTSTYEIVLQKNGQVDIKTPGGRDIIANGYPCVWLEGKDAPTPLPLEGRVSGYIPVADKLSRGQGMALRWLGCEWNLHAYPAEPFFIVQASYKNIKKKPVRVKMLSPLCVGDKKDGGVWLGDGTRDAVILENSLDGAARLTRGQGESASPLAVFNPATGRSIIVGFLTSDKTVGRIRLEPGEAGGRFGVLNAECVYDPPIELQPGERIVSEALYVAVTERDVLEGLERFGQSVVKVNGLDDAERPADLAGVLVESANVGEEARGWAESLANAARHYCWSGTARAEGVGPVPLGNSEIPWSRRLAWLTGAALSGGPVTLSGPVSELGEAERAALQQLLPRLRRAARPLDLFTADQPAVWSYPVKSRLGDWNLVALFNWDETEPQTMRLPFRDLGLTANRLHTIYGFWEDTYYGAARDELTVKVPADSVMLLGIRRYEERPMFLSTDRHISQGATDHTALEWDTATNTLRGVFDGVADTNYNLRVLVPEGYMCEKVTVSAGDAQTTMDGAVLKIGFRCGEAGPVEWRAEFNVK